MRAVAFIFLTFLTCALGPGQEKVVPVIVISYSPQNDRAIRQQGESVGVHLSLAGAMIALEGKEGRWEKDLAALSGAEVEHVEFTGFDPERSHTVSVRLRNPPEALNGKRPSKEYKGGEAFIFQISPGAHEYKLMPVSCDGKKTDVWATYALVTVDEERAIGPLGYDKGCKSDWALLK